MQRWIQTLKPTWWSGLGMLVLALGASGHAMAATITVNTLGDGNTGCTLRRALSNANAANQGAAECTRGDAAGNEIRFDSSAQAIVLTAGNGPLTITRTLAITGNGAAATSISGGGLVRVLDIPVGTSVTLTLNGLTVQNGQALASSTMSNAGGLFIPVGSTANLSNCAFRNNSAESSGGAIENRGALTINTCTFSGNTAAGEGGAIRNIGTMTVDGSLFNSNTADRGGAVWVNRTAVTNIDLLNSKFGGNTGGSIGGTVVLGTAVMNATGSSATFTTTGSVSQGQAYPEGPPTITVQPTTPVTVGSAATLTATLTGSSGTPTGTVSLLSGVDAIAACANLALTNGTASCSPIDLVVGVHTITAQYPGDSTYQAGTSAGVAQVINGSTNADTKQVTVSGPQNAEVWVDSANKGTITATGKLTVVLDTPAPDGAKPFLVETKTAGGDPLVSGTLTIKRDGTAPEFTGLQPADNGFLGATSTIGYTLNEDVVAGATIVLTHTGGAADPTPHTCTLQGTALNAGTHQIAYAANANGCTTALNLVSNAIYTIAFSGTDKAGNASAATQVTGVTYDTTAPTASLTLATTSTSRTITVAAGAFTGSDAGSGIAAAGYCLQETNVSTNCVWGAVPTSYLFGSDGNKTLYGFVKDNAGNVSTAASASVLVDSSVPTAPTLATTPTYAIGNSTALTVQSAENGLQVWVGNTNTNQVIAGGTASIMIDTSGIANGQQATFRITLRDAAGNVSAELVLPLTRDTTAPVFSATTPANNAAIKANAALGFTLSKAVASARITATRTGGTADGASPHTCTLQGTALNAGAHVVVLTADANGCTAPLGLVDGAIYTFAFDATDAATNNAVTASITGVTYDTSAPPAPLVTSPANNASGEGSSLAISGTAEAGSRVEVYEAATLLGSATATGGNFSITVAGLSFALHNFTLKAIDAAGNESGNTALAYTAQVPSSGGGSPPPAVITQGTATVTPGTPVTIGGSVQVTASPGSTITLNPQSGGSTITLPPAGSGGGTPAPVTLVIGGQTFSIQPQPNTATVLSVVTLVGANGQPQVALVLNPSTSGDSQVTLSGTVSQGTVVALLSTTTGNLPLTAQGDGVVSVTLVTTPRAAAGTPQSWSVFVGTGRVALPPATNGTASVTVLSGEVARLDGTGKVQSVRLGTVAGKGLGDPVQRGDLPAGINANVGFVRLAGVPTRTGGNTPLETLVNSGLRTVGITSSAQSADGSVTWTLGGASFPVVPLEVRVVPGRADGVTVADDGSIEVATAGLVTRFGPALQSLAAMGQALTGLGASTVLQPNGALRVSLGTTVFHLRPQWLPMGRTGNAPGFVFSNSAGLVFTDANGVSQALQGDVADYEGLTSLLQSLLGPTTTLRTGLDLQTELSVGNQRFVLVADLALLPATSGPAGSSWWFEGSKLFVRYPGGLVQGFAVTAR